ncbi:glycosyltransferase family 2 protein [Psychrobacillus psychrotolerans]|uniref:glycosyltransferase family 2 protein n=1 Tax=Psychrobacillus psychrotolerans TaxID=126156 RepID=UPI003B021D74
MENNSLISVIIPAYNSGKFIRKTIDSVLNQSFDNFEVLVINDGSTDKTEEIVKEYIVRNPKVRLINQNNSGVSVARNMGIKESKGDYICFLDSDDFYDVLFLEKMFNEIKLEDSEVCYCGYNKITPMKKVHVFTNFQKENVLKNYILGKVRVHTTGWMIKKELISKNNILFSEELAWGEDFEFFCKVLGQSNKICYVKDYLTNYTVNINDDRLSTFSIKKIDNDFETIKKISEYREIDKNIAAKRVLINYRLPALVSYRLLNAYKYKVEENIILDYFNKYENYIVKFSFNNGIRSLKLNISIIYLLLKIIKIKKDITRV